MVGLQTERAIIVIPQEVVEKIDRYRGELSSAEFINLCIDTLLQRGEEPTPPQGRTLPLRSPEESISRREFEEFKKGIKKLQQAYIDLLLSATLEPLSKASAEEQRRFKEGVAELLGR